MHDQESERKVKNKFFSRVGHNILPHKVVSKDKKALLSSLLGSGPIIAEANTWLREQMKFLSKHMKTLQ